MTSNAMHHASGAIHSVAPPALPGAPILPGGPSAPGAMDVDQPSTSGAFGGGLKRSNSAPMINVLGTDQPMTGTHISPPEPPVQRKDDSRRVRHFSSNSISLHAAPPPPSSLKLPSRLHQIKHEDKQQAASREAASEKDFQSTMQIQQSWDELRLDVGDNLMNHDGNMMPMSRQRSLSESVHTHTFFSPSGSPSPTRVGKQCFSPAMQAPVRNMTLTPSPSPSPTRKTFTRSLSPIAIKPSSLSLKRKLDVDDQSFNHYHSPAKKFSTGHHSSSTPSTPDRAPLAHPLAQSISSSNLELISSRTSPEQAVPTGAALSLSDPHHHHHSSPLMGAHSAMHPAIVPINNQGLLQTVSEPFRFRPVVSVADSLATNNTCAHDHPMTNNSH